MSDLNQINTALERLFHEEGQRVVFWNDPDREFQNTLPFLALDGVKVLRLDEVGSLETKVRLERGEPNGKFLLYAPTEEPDYENDWLLDIRLYSRSFRADRASILLQELGLLNQQLRLHIADRRKFFDSKERVQKLKGLVTPEDAAADLDRKMLAVVAKAEQSDPFTIVRNVLCAWTEAGLDVDLDLSPGIWEQIEKLDLESPFWQMVKKTFGYCEDNPSLKNLLLRLMVTDFGYSLKNEVPQSLRPLLLPRSGWSNTVVCLAQWRDSSSNGSSYDRLSKEAADVLKITDHLSDFEIDNVLDVLTFLAVEYQIVSSLKDRVQSTADTINAEEVRAIASRRQAGHWASATVAGSSDVPRKALHAAYVALVVAADFFALRNSKKNGFDYSDAASMYRAYEKELYRFDQLYRLFCEAADRAEKEGWNLLKPLRGDVEKCYVNWYLTALAMTWGKFIEPPGGLLARWQIDEVPNQFRFYDRNVTPWLEEADNRRAFVIISDAFRYEAAQELASELNGKYRFQAELTSQLGVLPSYTALGMASLLPHKVLSYKPGTGDVLADGKSTVAGERDHILQAVGGMACKADELLAKKKEEGREFVKDKRTVYIYHDKVDAIGDDSKTEGETFQAVRQAIEELTALVGHIINNLNGYYVIVTADHGFVFTETAPGETDKSKLEDRPDGTLVAKKRYLLGRGLPDHPAAWHGQTSLTAGAGGDMEFWIPKGTNRFHFTGGSRFIHGGAMLQEVVVPVLTVKHVRGKSAQETKAKPVTVHVLGANHRITTAKHRFQLIQMEPIGGRVRPITLKIAVYDREEPVTNVETVTFDSASGDMDERKKWVTLVLQDRQYAKKTPYRLILRDSGTGVEQQSVEVMIDRVFTDEF